MNKKFLIFFILSIFLLTPAFSYAAEIEQPKVLARVNSEDITEQDVMRALQALGQQAMMFYGNEEGKKMLIDEIISIRLFSLDGEKEKLDETPEFQAALANFKRSMLAQATMREIVKDVKVTDEEAKNFYDEHSKEYFTQPERIHARHILISDDVKSHDIISKIQSDLKSGVSFDELAKEFSIDPGSGSSGGDLGEFPKGVMVLDFENAAFALKNPGDISEPVKTQFGWHIIKLEEKFPEGIVPFNDVKSQIIQELQNTKSSELLKKRSDELEKIYKVERF